MIENRSSTLPNPTAPSDTLTTLRLKALMQYAPYRALERIAVEYRKGVALLRGELPSFYLKQVAQTVVASVDGVDVVDNRIAVRSRRRPAAEAS